MEHDSMHTYPQRCPRCRGTGKIDDAAPNVDPGILQTALRAACAAAGGMVTVDGRTDERAAAALIGQRPKTLSNWRHKDRPIPFVKRNRRVLYAFSDLAAWLVAKAAEPKI